MTHRTPLFSSFTDTHPVPATRQHAFRSDSVLRPFASGSEQADPSAHSGHLWWYGCTGVRHFEVQCANLFCPEELAQAVPSAQSARRDSASSNSPHIPFQRLALADNGAPHPQTPGASSRGQSSRSPATYPDSSRPTSPPSQTRSSSEAYRAILPQTHTAYSRAGIVTRHIDPNALATSGYPYAASQPLPPNAQGQQYPYDPSMLDRQASASGRYECMWCGKGFTRPSSLRVRPCDNDSHDVAAN